MCIASIGGFALVQVVHLLVYHERYLIQYENNSAIQYENNSAGRFLLYVGGIPLMPFQ